MKFCKECGTPLEPGAKHCSACGWAVPAEPPVPAASGKPAVKMPAFKPTKKQKILGVAIAAVLIILFAGFQIAQSLTSVDRFVSQFHDALLENDADRLSAMMDSDDPRLQMSEEDVQSFLDHLDRHPSEVRNLVEAMKNQAELMVSDKGDAESHSHEAPALMNLRQSGRRMLFFPRYYVEPMAYYLTLQTNYEGVDLFINDQLVATAAEAGFSREFGPFMPATYTLRAVLEGDYVDLETEEQLSLFDPYRTSVDVTLNLHGSFVSLWSDYEDVTVLINGEDTGLVLTDRIEFGPVSTDGSLMLQGEKRFPWGAIQSEPVELTGQNSHRIQMNPMNETLQENLMEVVTDFYASSVEASRTIDPSLLRHHAPSLQEEKARQLADRKESDQAYLGRLMELHFDLDSFQASAGSDAYTASMNLRLVGEETWHRQDAENPQPRSLDQNRQVRLAYDPAASSWLVTGTGSLWRIGTSNVVSVDLTESIPEPVEDEPAEENEDEDDENAAES